MKINTPLALSLFFCATLAGGGAARAEDGRQLYAEVYAIQNSFENNRLGAYHPYGLIYALASDTVSEDHDHVRDGKKETVKEYSLRNGKRPRPLVLRMNVGDTMTVKFTNHIKHVPFNVASLYASMHAAGVGLKESILSDGSWVGVNTNSPRAEVWPGGTAYYRFTAEAEGVFLMYSQASNSGPGVTAGQLSQGLFGAIVVEPKGAEYYRSQVTAEDLKLSSKDGSKERIINYQATYPKGYKFPGDLDGADREGTPILNMLRKSTQSDPVTKTKFDWEVVHTDLTALITGPYAKDFPQDSKGPSFEKNPSYPERWKPWREFTIFYHDDFVNRQAFDQNPEYPSTQSDNFAINYGIAGIVPTIFANRIQVGPQQHAVTAKFEEFFLSSWACGDPAMPVDIPANTKPKQSANFAKYPDDPSNVYHSYMNDHVKFRILHAGSNLTHVHHLHAHQWLRSAASDESHYLDSQTISPGATDTLDIVYGGSGNKNKTVGDSIFHCHFYPHFAGGMWSLWRVHDVFEEGTPLLKGDQWPKIDASANGGWVRALPDGEIATGTPIPALIPVPTIAMAPEPAKVKLVAAEVPDASDPTKLATVGQVAQVDEADLAKKLNPGFPFYIPGVGGQRPPHPPLDFALDKGKPLDGGLPRHLVLGADSIYEQHSHADFTKEIGTFDEKNNKFVPGKAVAVKLPEGGTKAEWVAMAAHATRNHPTRLPDGGQPSPAQAFVLNGKPPAHGAPFADPLITLNGETPKPELPVRTYKAANIQLDVVFNKKGWHYPQQRIITLWDDVKPTLGNTRRPEPFFFRANSGECVEFWQTNLVPNYYEWDNFQIRTPTDIIGQHIHLVKFDVTASDGAANGFNYEDGTFSPGEVRTLIEVINHAGGLYAPSGSDYDNWLPGTPSTYAWPVNFSASPQRLQLTAVAHPVLNFGKDFGQDWLGAQTTIQRWFADPVLDNQGKDRTLRTVFTHDHFGPSTHQQTGLYAGLLVEPAGTEWWSNTHAQQLGGRPDGGPTSWEARIIDPKDPTKAFREFALEFGDTQLAYQPASKAKVDDYVFYKSGSFGSQKPPQTYRGWITGGAKAAGVNTPQDSGQFIPIYSQAFNQGGFALNYRSEPVPFRTNAFLFNPDGNGGSAPADYRNDPIFSLVNAYSSIKRHDPQLNKQPAQGDKIADGVNKYAYPAPFTGAGDFDPYTPLLRAYKGDKVQVRTLVGSQIAPHSFMIEGLNWLYEPDYEESGYINAQTMGISEHFEMQFQLPYDKRPTVDYLYRASSGKDGFEAGCWGLLRSYGENTDNLVALPNAAKVVPPNLKDSKTIKFTVFAMREQITAPDGSQQSQIVYKLKDDVDLTPANANPATDVITAITRKKGTAIEPLILRCNAGDIVEIELYNFLSSFGQDDNWRSNVFTAPNSASLVTYPFVPGEVGLDVPILAPLSESNGVTVNVSGPNVGLNNVGTGGSIGPNNQLVPPPAAQNGGGFKLQKRTYAWYAGRIDPATGAGTPVEFGAVNILPVDHYEQQAKGLIGGLIVEPVGSTVTLDRREDLNVPITRASAMVTSGDKKTSFREFVAVFEDDNNVLGGTVINYQSAPFDKRMPNANLDVHRVLSDTMLNPPADPPTPVFAAAKGSPVRMRMLHPGGSGNDMTIALHGHSWQEEPWQKGSTVLGDNSKANAQGSHDRFGPNCAFNMLLNKAGGLNEVTGDYLLRDFLTGSYQDGGWSIVRVGDGGDAKGLDVVSIINYPGAYTIISKDGKNVSTNVRIPSPGEEFTLSGRNTVNLRTGVLAKQVTIEVNGVAIPQGPVPVKVNGTWEITTVTAAKLPATVKVTSSEGGTATLVIKPRLLGVAELADTTKKEEEGAAEFARARQLSKEPAVEPVKSAVTEEKPPAGSNELMRERTKPVR